MTYKTFKTNWKKHSKLLAAALLLASGTATGKDVTLRGGTVIPMQLTTTVNCRNVSVGQVIDFRVTRDIQADGVTVIPAGSIAKGQVARVKKNGIFGKEGELQVSVNSVTAVDGTQVMLSGGNLYDEGSDKLIVSFFLCFLIKGGSAELAAGMECTPSVSGNTVISVD